ncbi:uncharacterized protein LOC121626493 [Chelmon rostratus]|uniref:uncharacterized protein LOC121626493 n=1 Tax=Chelmon rostratus TaxID=109905 RepID=UPI001BEB81DE|nr:uncharacterized protein LOC121626493 [Chelmon rostratus]
MLKLYVLLVSLCRAYGALLYANTGHNVTLPCFYASDSAKHLCWYKQVAGERPQIISSFYKHSPDTNSFHNQFKGDKRFSVHAGRGFYHLNISNVQSSDSAAYYCGQISVTVTEFNNGIFLVVKASSRKSFPLQPESESVQPGGSVSLNCTVHTGTSDGEPSVYWFKKDARNSHVGITHVHTHSSGRCVKSPDFPAQGCVCSLSKRNVSLSDAGTYFCAVASCGEILFGKGTKLNVGGEHVGTTPVLMLCTAAALLVSVILNVILIGVLCKMSRTKSHHSAGTGLHPKLSVPEYTAESQNKESDALQYVALDFKKRQSKSRRQRSTEEETIYSGVRLSHPK